MTIVTKTTKTINNKQRNENKKNGKEEEEKTPNTTFRYGPMPKFSSQRIWSRGMVIFGVLIYVWYTSKNPKETSFAKQKEVLPKRGQNFECDSVYLKEIQQYPSCVPEKCGRYISDKIVTINEAETLLNVAKRALASGGSSGGASILDLHSGAMSHGEKFINIYALDESSKKFVTATDFAVYKIVKNKIQRAIAEAFQIDAQNLYLTHPTFFSKMTNLEAKTIHDEYWHIHVDKETYESFHYTSLLYLTDYDIDFKGGIFIFVDSAKNITVEPRKGRILIFTSGAENPHFVERVIDGTRYAITISFTCDKSKAIRDPVGQQ